MLSGCVNPFAIRYDDNESIASVTLFGKSGGEGGTNFPKTSFNCAIEFETEDDVVSVSALLVKLP